MSWIKISSQNTNKSELNGRRKTFLCPVSAWRQSPVQAVSCSRSRRPDEASGLQPPQPRTVRATPPRSTHQRDCSRYPYLVHIYLVHIATVLSKYLLLWRSLSIDRQSMFCKLSFSVTMSGQSAQPCTVCSYRVHYITTINHRKCHASPNNVVLLVEFVIELERMIRNKEKGKWLSPFWRYCMASCSVMQWGEHVHGAGPGGVAAALQCDHRLTAAAASSHCSSRTFRCQHVDPGPRRVFRPLLLQLLHFVGQETIDVGGGISDGWVWVDTQDMYL